MRTFPTDSQETQHTEVNAVVYRYTTKGKPAACGFSGRRQKADFRFYFGNEERREQHITKWLEGLQAQHNEKMRRAAERKAFKHSLTVGEILVSSWGYDQTNIDFYQVVELKAKTMVIIREIASDVIATGDMTGTRTAIANDFIGDEITCRVQPGNRIRLNSYSGAWVWDREPKSYSTYA